jgi:hypothetical protein
MVGAALIVVGCGSSDEQSPADAAVDVKHVIRESFTARDPAKCRLATPAFLEQTTLLTDEDATNDCIKGARADKPARSIAVEDVVARGHAASANAVVKGGDRDGESLTLSLVREDGQWKLDRITAIHINRARWNAAERRLLARSPVRAVRKRSGCIVERLRRLSNSHIERTIVASDRKPFDHALEVCSRRRLNRGQFETGLRQGLKGSGLSGAQADCVVAQLRARLTDAQISEMVQAAGIPADLEAKVARAAIACRLR